MEIEDGRATLRGSRWRYVPRSSANSRTYLRCAFGTTVELSGRERNDRKPDHNQRHSRHYCFASAANCARSAEVSDLRLATCPDQVTPVTRKSNDGTLPFRAIPQREGTPEYGAEARQSASIVAEQLRQAVPKSNIAFRKETSRSSIETR